jgi:hypothetical protein
MTLPNGFRLPRLMFAAEALTVIGVRRCPVSAKANWTNVVTNSGHIASSGIG